MPSSNDWRTWTRVRAELSLPAGLEAFFVRPLTRASSGFRGPFATLLKKEFRLQQISFLLAGVFLLFAVVGACLIKRYPNLGGGIVAADCCYLRADPSSDCRGDFRRGRERLGHSRMASDFAAVRAEAMVGQDVSGAFNQPGSGCAAANRRVPGRGIHCSARLAREPLFRLLFRVLAWVLGHCC